MALPTSPVNFLDDAACEIRVRTASVAGVTAGFLFGALVGAIAGAIGLTMLQGNALLPSRKGRR